MPIWPDKLVLLFLWCACLLTIGLDFAGASFRQIWDGILAGNNITPDEYWNWKWFGGSRKEVSSYSKVTNEFQHSVSRGPRLVGSVGEEMPYLEWFLENPGFSGNPYDLDASVSFCHKLSGECKETLMFYDGGAIWRFRFPQITSGVWDFRIKSNAEELNGHQGHVTIEHNKNRNKVEFITSYGNKWFKSGAKKAFVPQFVMYGRPNSYFKNPTKIDADIEEFIIGHGFSGFHTNVLCEWFDLEKPSCRDICVSDPIPDRRTFEALELLIVKVHAAGGVVHIWSWGDDQRGMNPKHWGLNGFQDRRLLRYIAARLGPIPGWTMGYGFDLHEWVTGEQLTEWHRFLGQAMGYSHMLGARSHKNSLGQISETMDYSSYEQHKPTYVTYVRTIEKRPWKPSFSEDRFRVRRGGDLKDYSPDETRRGLWHSAMAGGVANIWGYLLDGGSNENGSTPYPNKSQIKTYSSFFDRRFLKDLRRCNELTDGFCLKQPTDTHFIFYKEDASTIKMDLSSMQGEQRAVAVDARRTYHELSLGKLQPTSQTWNAPYSSDWALAIGAFE